MTTEDPNTDRFVISAEDIQPVPAPAYDRLTTAATRLAGEHGDEIDPSIYGLEIHGPNGTVSFGRSASDAATIRVATYGLSADGGERPRQTWSATFTPTTPSRLLVQAARQAIDAIN